MQRTQRPRELETEEHAARSRTPRKRGGPGAILWIAPALLLLGAFVYFPIVENLRLSFTNAATLGGPTEWIGIDNYQRAVADPIFWRALFNNVAYAVVSVVCQVGGGLILAYLIDTFASERVQSFLRSIYFLPATISITVAGVLFQFLYSPRIGPLAALAEAIGRPDWVRDWLGDPDTAIWAVIFMSQWQFTGYVTALLIVAMQKVPTELYEAARLDRASHWQQFRFVTIPLIRDMTGIMTVFTISGALLVFNQIVVMTGGGPNNASQTLGTWLYRSAFVLNDRGYAAVLAVVMFVLTLGTAVIYVRRTSSDPMGVE